MSRADQYYKEELNEILTKGFNDKDFPVRPNWINEDGTKTPAHTIKLFGRVNRYDLTKEFPILTLRRAPFKYAVKELLWIFQKKSNNIHDLDSRNWDSWADETGSIGKTYGFVAGEKYPYPEQNMDQIDNVLWTLKNRPMDRRMIVQLFRPEYIRETKLPPCVMTMIFDRTDKYLNMTAIFRSSDFAAAGCAGISDEIEMALLLAMIAQSTGLIAKELLIVKNNLHIYDRTVDLMKEVAQNKDYPAPKLYINPEKTDFYSFTLDDFKLIDYKYSEFNKKIPVAV